MAMKTAVIFSGRDFDASYRLSTGEAQGFRKGWNALRKSAGGSAEVPTLYMLPEDEEELKARATDEFDTIEQEAIDRALAAHRQTMEGVEVVS
jgi:hypothetical protein